MNSKRTKITIGTAIVVAAVGIAVYAIPQSAAAGRSGELDDGKDLLPNATITLDQAIAAAQTQGAGAIGEVDLEYLDGVLVFNVDVGDLDVKVDAATGSVVGSESDD